MRSADLARTGALVVAAIVAAAVVGVGAAALRPRQADQFGSFYPAWHGHAAMIDLPWAGRWPRVVPAAALTTLRRFGVPIRLR